MVIQFNGIYLKLLLETEDQFLIVEVDKRTHKFIGSPVYVLKTTLRSVNPFF